ncbi:MAG: glycosyl hydrolase 53 family protein [Bacteroidota bacterium]
MKIYFILSTALCAVLNLNAQSFYLGTDMSYVNEMEDCGVTYFENQEEKDPYAILENNGGNFVRLRLWHTPSWYDELNNGNRYSDLNDVKRAIARAKQQNLEVLLDFHLSDNWADPNKQLVPAAWLSVVDNTEILKDSLYNYVHHTLTHLNAHNLLPDMIQVGNETNKGILLSPEDNAVWTLDWERNAVLFNSAIQAIKDVEEASEKDVKIMLHVAAPDNAEWLIDGFIDSGVTDFDVIGISYYWAWHKPTTIAEAGEVIQSLRTFYPDKEVIIVETGYIWTTEWNDSASNIISETHPDYHPASPVNQRDWLIELTKEVMQSGGSGVLYWEPFWVSSDCYTQWGQGSHQEHAAFFDFDNHLILPGGIEWLNYNYAPTSTQEKEEPPRIQILSNSFSGDIKIKQSFDKNQELSFTVTDSIGNTISNGNSKQKEISISIADQPFGIYVVRVSAGNLFTKSRKILYSKQ